MKKKETTFYLVRHGETVWNRQRRMQGHKDSPLTKLGRQQAIRLRGEFRNIKFDRVLSSDLERAKTTGRLIVGDSVEFWTTESLRERNYGPYEGWNIKEYQAIIKPQTDIANSLPPEQRWAHRLAPGIETTVEVQNRILGFLTWAAWIWAGDTMLVPSHGSGIKYTVAKIGAMELDDPHLVIANGSYFKIVHDGKKFKVLK